MASYSTQTLAQGCFGKIYKEKYEDTWAAIKKVPRHLISERDLHRECAVYKKSNHPNIVKLLGPVTLRDGKWIIPLEFIFGEDLETTIFKASKSKIQLTPAIKGTIITGMCEGLLHLHSKDIVHQDLKPDNIMVEHKTNRAVIIDMGLAKFFRCGLSSAADMGNEAYSAPEVLQRGSQRNQQSDVWAMGKIIAELCARIRLHTPSVCPAKIKEILKDQPYCHAVCRMTEPNPSLRASMGGVMSDLRRAADAKSSADKDLLKPPSAHINVRDKSPSPANRDPSPIHRSPFNRDPTPINRAPSPFNRDPSPMRRAASPFNRDPSPMRRAPSPFNRDPTPINRAPSPFNRDPSPMRRAPSPFNRDPTPINIDPSPLDRTSPPKKWERSPKPDLNALRPQAHRTPSPQRTEDKTKHTALVPVGGAATELNQDFLKMQLYQEAAKGLPCNLPTTGRVVVRRFEQKNGEVETWAQKEVVTRDGKIIKYDDVTFNSK